MSQQHTNKTKYQNWIKCIHQLSLSPTFIKFFYSSVYSSVHGSCKHCTTHEYIQRVCVCKYECLVHYNNKSKMKITFGLLALRMKNKKELTTTANDLKYTTTGYTYFIDVLKWIYCCVLNGMHAMCRSNEFVKKGEYLIVCLIFNKVSVKFACVCFEVSCNSKDL